MCRQVCRKDVIERSEMPAYAYQIPTGFFQSLLSYHRDNLYIIAKIFGKMWGNGAKIGGKMWGNGAKIGGKM